MRVALASDHRGFRCKEAVKDVLRRLGHTPTDFGTDSEASVDYPDLGFKAAEAVAGGECERAILICHTGIGMSIAANKVRGIRAALCCDSETAELSRMHNDANVLVLPAKTHYGTDLSEMLKKWLETQFEGGRHQRRLERISVYETDR
jgi:RpiB/LacA/LacB family sugar-phosphate isomerase